MAHEELDILLKSVAIPASGLTAVETDTSSRMQEIMDAVKNSIEPERPVDVVYIETSKTAGRLHEECLLKIKGWVSESGILFLTDNSGGSDEDSLYRFWSGMNSYREHWSALGCHVIFILLPASYRFLMRAADHLADWMPLKLHIFGNSSYPDLNSQSMTMPAITGSEMSPSTAHMILSTYESSLIEMAEKGQDHPSIIRRYYLPMLEAALAIHDLKRAESLRKKINEEDIAPADLPNWWKLNFKLDFYLHRLDSAFEWAMKIHDHALESGNSSQLASYCNNLGIIAQKRRDFAAAEIWYKKSLGINEKSGNENGAAITYHQIGRIAEERRDFETAEKWYRKSLGINEKSGNKNNAAITYHQMGFLAQERRDFEAAEKWYRKSLEVNEKTGNEHDAASNCHELGRIAQECKKFDVAEKWYRKSLEIKEKLGNEHGAALTYGQMGNLFLIQGEVCKGGPFYLKALKSFIKLNDVHAAQIAEDNFRQTYKNAGSETRDKLAAMWKESTGKDIDMIEK